jgi:hypothetical protein
LLAATLSTALLSIALAVPVLTDPAQTLPLLGFRNAIILFSIYIFPVALVGGVLVAWPTIMAGRRLHFFRRAHQVVLAGAGSAIAYAFAVQLIIS